MIVPVITIMAESFAFSFALSLAYCSQSDQKASETILVVVNKHVSHIIYNYYVGKHLHYVQLTVVVVSILRCHVGHNKCVL